MMGLLRRVGPEAWFLLLAAALLGANLGDGSLLPSDDCLYATAAREMARSGDLVTPTWQGRPLFDKGPVLFWVLAASRALLDDSEAAMRLPGVLAALATLVLLWRLGLALGLSRPSAIGAVALALASNVLYFNARRPMTDLVALALGLAGFLVTLRGRRPLLGGALLGLSALTKLTGPAPFVLGLLVLQFVRRFRLSPRGAGLALAGAGATTIPWHAAMLALHGRPFLDVYLGYHVLERAARTIVGDASEPTYLAWLFEREGPLLAILLPALVLTAVRAVRKDPAGLLALALWLGAGLPLALARTALPHYLVALLPGAALSCSLLVERLLLRAGERLRIWVVAAWLLVAALAFLANNARDLATPDYGPGTRDLCMALRARGEIARLAGTCDLHDPCVTWYCDAPVFFFALDKGFYRAVQDIPALEGTVRPIDSETWQGLAMARSLLMVRHDREGALIEAAKGAGVLVRRWSEAAGRLLVEVVPEVP